MVRIARAALLGLAIALLGAAIPTPGPGTGQPLAQPTPVNPVQYVVTPGQTGSSAAQNSNFYKVYSDLAMITSALNGCGFIPGAAIGTIAAVSPLNVAISSCSAGTGTGATATISLGGVVPMANTFPTPQFTYTTSNANGATAGYQPPVYNSNGTITSTTEHIVRGTIIVTVPVNSTTSATSYVLPFSGAAAFSTAASYTITATVDFGISTQAGGWNTNTSAIIYSKTATSIVILVTDSPATATNSAGLYYVDFVAIGY